MNNNLSRHISRLKPIAVSRRGSLALYSFRACESYYLMEEVGRLREQAFSQAGGGTGESLDIDCHDLARNGYRQLIAWDTAKRRIVGGYRYIVGGADDKEHISTLKYFSPSPNFSHHYLPHAVELGRSFVVHDEGSSLFGMTALWQGLASTISQIEGVRYLFGKVTVYPHYEPTAYRLLRLFLKQFHPAQQALLKAFNPHIINEENNPFSQGDYNENYALLLNLLRQRGENLPPMIHAYMRLCRSMQSFDTVCNKEFGNTLETAILLPLNDINNTAKERYF